MKRLLQSALSVFTLFYLSAQSALGADASYLLVQDLPFIKTSDSIGSYFQNLFKLGLGLAVVFAVLMIVIAGIEYMVSDVPGVKGNAKGRMTNALIGLILAFSGVLILQTINPALVRFDIIATIEKAAKDAGSTTGGTTTGGNSEQEQALRDRLKESGIEVNKGGCATPAQEDCTNLSDLPGGTIERIIALQSSCRTSQNSTSCVYITGGAEAGHETHGAGLPMVDLRKTSDLTAYIQKNDTTPQNTCFGPGTLYTFGGSEYLDEGNHWHACMGTQCRFKPGCKQ